jgi:putative transposase
MSYYRMIFHIVFSTFRRAETINEQHERELYAYIMGIIGHLGGHLYRIGGVPDHLHIIAEIPPKVSPSNFVKTIKQSSSNWLHGNNDFPQWRGWEEGYGIFTVSYSNKDEVIEYVKNQKTHHAKITYAEENRKILEDAHIMIDERYMPK